MSIEVPRLLYEYEIINDAYELGWCGDESYMAKATSDSRGGGKRVTPTVLTYSFNGSHLTYSMSLRLCPYPTRHSEKVTHSMDAHVQYCIL